MALGQYRIYGENQLKSFIDSLRNTAQDNRFTNDIISKFQQYETRRRDWVEKDPIVELDENIFNDLRSADEQTRSRAGEIILGKINVKIALLPPLVPVANALANPNIDLNRDNKYTTADAAAKAAADAAGPNPNIHAGGGEARLLRRRQPRALAVGDVAAAGAQAGGAPGRDAGGAAAVAPEVGDGNREAIPAADDRDEAAPAADADDEAVDDENENENENDVRVAQPILRTYQEASDAGKKRLKELAADEPETLEYHGPEMSFQTYREVTQKMYEDHEDPSIRLTRPNRQGTMEFWMKAEDETEVKAMVRSYDNETGSPKLELKNPPDDHFITAMLDNNKDIMPLEMTNPCIKSKNDHDNENTALRILEASIIAGRAVQLHEDDIAKLKTSSSDENRKLYHFLDSLLQEGAENQLTAFRKHVSDTPNWALADSIKHFEHFGDFEPPEPADAAIVLGPQRR